MRHLLAYLRYYQNFQIRKIPFASLSWFENRCEKYQIQNIFYSKIWSINQIWSMNLSAAFRQAGVKCPININYKPCIITGANKRTLTSLAPSTHWEFSISILKLNVKMAPKMSGFFNWLPLHLFIPCIIPCIRRHIH